MEQQHIRKQPQQELIQSHTGQSNDHENDELPVLLFRREWGSRQVQETEISGERDSGNDRT
jgi:hypothetical protein